MQHNWYAIYTNSNSEAKLQNNIMAHSKLHQLGYQTYLPMITEVRQYSDRKKSVRMPMFKSYLFVKHCEEGFCKIKNMPGFCNYVRFGAQPAQMHADEINTIKQVNAHFDQVSMGENHFCRGDKVRIFKGPLANHEGILVYDQSGSKVLLEIKSLRQKICIKVPLDSIIKLAS